MPIMYTLHYWMENYQYLKADYSEDLSDEKSKIVSQNSDFMAG